MENATWEGRSKLELTGRGGLRRKRYELDCSAIWRGEEKSTNFLSYCRFSSVTTFV